MGNTGGFEFYLQNRGDGGPEKLAQAMGIMQGAAGQSPVLAGVQTLWRPNTPQLKVDLDRERAKALGVPVNDAFNTLAGTLGTYYVNDFNKYGRAWQVLMSADAEFRMKPEDINHIYVKSDKGEMIPMSALANIKY
ncbi:MAG TPA: efflux RND transporter permease subunit, partial [Rheinheimera sp.]|nr:efflux RND transporter permease subunit [Rheinheimera sp.]